MIKWKGKLHQDTGEFRDWGWIRDEAGALIFRAELPFSSHSPESAEHRKNGTDPTQARVDALLAALNSDGGKCLWTFDEHSESYDTACNNKFVFMQDGLSENNFKFCPYCGGEIGEME